MRFVSQRTMSAGGYISGSGVSPGDIDMNGGRLFDSAGPLNLGADATTGYSLSAGDVLLGGKLEVDGEVRFDDNIWQAHAKSLYLSQTRVYGFSANGRLTIEDAAAGGPTEFRGASNGKTTFGSQYGGLGCLTQSVSYSDFVDGGGVVGTLNLSNSVPDGAVVERCIIHTLTGFTGGANSTATVQIGDGTDVDRYNTGTPDVYTTNASGVDMGAVSGTAWHDDAKTPVITITVDNDWSTIAAGAFEIAIFYFGP